jgi:uncharacterized protein (DUF736 family)
VNCLNSHLSEADRGYVHLFATSADVQDTARSLALRDFTCKVLLPELIDLTLLLVERARKYADIPQIGRTHGRFAEPITVGYWLANFVVRLAGRAEKIAEAAQDLRGMFSGAVGAHNALALNWPNDPAAMEIDVLARLGLKPGEGSVSTQIVQPEYLTDYAHAIVSAFGVLANVADDFKAQTSLLKFSVQQRPLRGAPSIASGPSITIEAAVVRARKQRSRRTTMATIGTFKKTGSNEFTGEIVTLSVQAKNVRIVPETSRSGENSPSHRVYVGRVEIGAAWAKRSNEGRDYLGLKLDDPSFTAPIFANLFDDEDGEGYSLIWSRPNGRRSD